MKKVKISELKNESSINPTDYAISLKNGVLSKLIANNRIIMSINGVDANVAAETGPQGFSIANTVYNSLNMPSSYNGVLLQIKRAASYSNNSTSQAIAQIHTSRYGLFYRVIYGSADGLVFGDWVKI